LKHSVAVNETHRFERLAQHFLNFIRRDIVALFNRVQQILTFDEVNRHVCRFIVPKNLMNACDVWMSKFGLVAGLFFKRPYKRLVG
jgi:hypothetical protein